MTRAPSDAGMDHIPEAGNFVSPGHDKASFDNGVRHAITWLHKRAGEMSDPHARQILNDAAFALGQERARAAGQEERG